MAGENTAWQLEDFVDSLVVELDKTRETLAVKAINKPLSYTVRDMALELNIFPSYDGDQVKFVTAQPGQSGASKVTIQLSSITDQQVRATTKVPSAKSDVDLAQMGVDRSTKKQLRKLGVTSLDDLKQLERKDVDLARVSDNGIDYKKLANQIQKSKRNDAPPRITGVSFSLDTAHGPCLEVRGRDLAVDPKFRPVAVVNDELAQVISSSREGLKLRLPAGRELGADTDVILTFDPYAITRFKVKQ